MVCVLLCESLFVCLHLSMYHRCNMLNRLRKQTLVLDSSKTTYLCDLWPPLPSILILFWLYLDQAFCMLSQILWVHMDNCLVFVWIHFFLIEVIYHIWVLQAFCPLRCGRKRYDVDFPSCLCNPVSYSLHLN